MKKKQKTLHLSTLLHHGQQHTLVTQLPTDTEATDARTILLSIAKYGQIMPWLIDDACLLASMYDTPLLHAEDITTIYNFCEEQFAEDEE